MNDTQLIIYCLGALVLSIYFAISAIKDFRKKQRMRDTLSGIVFEGKDLKADKDTYIYYHTILKDKEENR